MNSNMNFPSPLAFLGLAGAIVGLVVAAAVIGILFLARQRRAAKLLAMLTAAGGVFYAVLLFGCSLISQQKVLSEGGAKRYVVSLGTRFDETTISKGRPKDVPLMPSRRDVRIIDSEGRVYAPESSSGVSLMQPLIPGESYTTELFFQGARQSAATQAAGAYRARPARPAGNRQ